MSGMGVRIDQSGHRDHAGGFDALGLPISGVVFLTYGGDAPILDQNMAALDDAPVRVHRDDRGIFNQ